ncbi:unnamed protein product [Sphagnum jensenii]|uniref:Pentatricopeptide repeat-containing protein n=1 Tax=Sphagnum jensenii TaxID=128206 RepID=A0ABP0VKZ1_9BRYO
MQSLQDVPRLGIMRRRWSLLNKRNKRRALELSQQMHHEGVEADPGTFVGVLNACASVGALGRGRRVREQIIQCGFESDIFVDALYHYACIVDLLRRAGLLLEAEDLITMMPCVQDAAVWKNLLGACRHHGDAEMGEQIARKVLELDPGSATGYVLLTNIYAAGGKWDLSVKVRQRRLEKAVKKQPWVT